MEMVGMNHGRGEAGVEASCYEGYEATRLLGGAEAPLFNPPSPLGAAPFLSRIYSK